MDDCSAIDSAGVGARKWNVSGCEGSEQLRVPALIGNWLCTNGNNALGRAPVALILGNKA
jgi:hypothetical protein